MALVTSSFWLKRAHEERFAIGAFNASNMEMTQAIVETATEERSPVFLQVSQGAIRYAGLEYAVGLVKMAASLTDIPVIMHLDHATEYEQVMRGVRAGFTSLMYDGSARPFEQNVAITKKVCEIAHSVGIPVEGELGRISGSEDQITVSQLEATMTDPEQAAGFVELTGVDSLAVAVGSVHRMTVRTAELDFRRISALRKRVPVPLVLHGASGVPDEGIKEAVARGICKINVATALNKAFTDAVREALMASHDEVDPRKILAKGKEAVKDVVRQRIRLFGSAGKV